MSCRFALITAFLFSAFFCQAQTTATCDHWTFFNTFSPSGINIWNTVVGSGTQSDGSIDAYLRWANGGTEKFVDPNAAPPTDWTFFYRRNKDGVTVGSYRDANQYSHGLLFSGGKMATLDNPGSVETILYGINKWDSIVGIFNTGGDFSQPYDGFKMWKNGGVLTIHYPGAKMTNPMSISDTGTIVGWYVPNGVVAPFPYHGFVVDENGTYKELDYPNADRTLLNDINTSGIIAGTHITTGSNYSQGGFIYVSGVFKEVTASNAQVQTVDGINDNNYVVGTSSAGSFIAHCQ